MLSFSAGLKVAGSKPLFRDLRRHVEGVALIEPPPLAEADNSCGHIQQRAGGWFRGEVRKRSLGVPSKNFYPSTQIGAGSSEADFSSD
jgi:hypothetical protein